MQTIPLNVLARSGTGKGVARQLRREGMIPAVMYGRDTIKSLAVRLKELQHVLKVAHGGNAILEIAVDGVKRTVLLKDMQIDAIRQEPTHIDLFEISMDKKVKVMVEVVASGDEPVGLKTGGILTHVSSEVEVECLPMEIPQSFEVDVSALDVGDSLHVSDLGDRGVDILTSGDQLLFAVVVPAVEKEPEEEEVLEGVGEGEEEGAGEEEGEGAETKPAEPEEPSES